MSYIIAKLKIMNGLGPNLIVASALTMPDGTARLVMPIVSTS